MKSNNIFRGCLIGGAVGDALGYPVEFLSAESIFNRYGSNGITEYSLDSETGKALISDDTQMTLFTAVGLLEYGEKAEKDKFRFKPRDYVARAYLDWLFTQKNINRNKINDKCCGMSRLLEVPGIFNRRAPGNTCVTALNQILTEGSRDDYIEKTRNNSKGCGGIMRVAPVGLYFSPKNSDRKNTDMETAQIAAVTHGHSLGYMTSAVLAHIINMIAYRKSEELSLKDIIRDAEDTVAGLFSGVPHVKEMVDIINLSMELAENDDDDLSNIGKIGEGWVAEETLGIAIYCALKYQDDFDKAMIASVNHDGDSDSTGAVTGNILGALLGYDAISEKWLDNLELKDLIIQIADRLAEN